MCSNSRVCSERSIRHFEYYFPLAVIVAAWLSVSVIEVKIFEIVAEGACQCDERFIMILFLAV